VSRKGKRFVNAVRSFDKQATYTPNEALGLVKSMASAKFDETVELAAKLGIDPRKADQAVRGTVGLPHGLGKEVRVAVFAQGDAARKARDAGADVVGDADLVEAVQGGMLDFDVAIATPDMMGQVGKLGKLLGPRGLMPNPKSGTVTPNVGEAVAQFKAGRVEYRNDRFGNVHLPLGKASFDVASLLENYVAAIEELVRAKPASSKGRFLRSITVASTMGPGVKIDPSKPLPTEEAGAA
jgi:large subunit ribosomal protein L1